MVSARKLAPAIFLVMFMSTVYAFNVGVSPNNIHLGEVEAGETVELEIYVWSDADGAVIVDPEYRRGVGRYIHREDEMPFEVSGLSEQDTSEWVTWTEDEYEVDPETEVTADDGSTYEEVMPFEIDIPSNAEPGYRLAFVDIDLETGAGGQGSQLGIYSVPVIPITYEVTGAGTVDRSLDVNEVRSVRAGADVVRVDYLVENTGTVTTSLRDSDLSIMDDRGFERADDSLSRVRIAPGETEVVTRWWRDDSEIEAGEYRVSGELDYMTGQSFFESTIDIGDIIEIREGQEPDDPDDPSQGQPPYFLILMVLLVLGVLMYSFEVDPLYIISFLGVIGISAFVVTSGLPVYLAGLVIIMTLILLYYGG